MAVLRRDDFLSTLNNLIGEKEDDASLKIIEDMTETFDSMNTDKNIDWKEKYNSLDSEWRKKYKERFFTGSSKADKEFEKESEEQEETDDWKTNPENEFDMFYREEK